MGEHRDPAARHRATRAHYPNAAEIDRSVEARERAMAERVKPRARSESPAQIDARIQHKLANQAPRKRD